jgi:hypothetical protein
MFTTEHIHLDDRNDYFEFALNKVSEVINGMSFCGSGSMSEVWGNSSDSFVYKIVKGNDIGYFNYLREINKADPDNPFLPKIFSVIIYSFLGRPIRTIVKMEKLNRFNWESPAHEELDKLSRMIAKNHPISIFQSRQRRKQLNELRETVRNAMDSDAIRFDLHTGNWMIRGEHQLVLIDPLI